jgi:putative ABC transport system substrate-binding protein
LVRLKPDLIVAAGPEPLFAAVRQATRTIPVVMVSVDFDPVATGYIASLARPGGNLTGVTFRQAELAAKRLELLKETVPGLARVAVVWDTFSHDQMQSVSAAAAALKLQLHPIEFRDTPYDFEGALGAAARDGAGAVLSALSPEMFRERARLARAALDHRLPAAFPLREFADEGGLMSFGVNFPDQWRRAAEYADKVLKGAKPTDLPVEQPTKFELLVNLKTAKDLGIAVPESILVRADEVIE